MKKIVVLDYGSGNVHSAVKSLEAAGASVELTRDRGKALAAHGLVVPGVGAFSTVMENLVQVGAPEIIDQRLAGGKAVFGICVGLQVLFESGSESGELTEGLGQWPGVIEKLKSDKLPHVGWNDVQVAENSKLFRGIEEEQFYFVHSFAALDFPLRVEAPFQVPLISFGSYGEKFLAAVENGPLSGTQFHPEKSGKAGIKLLANWLDSI